MNAIQARHLGTVEYGVSYAAMREFTEARTTDVLDEVWLLQHPPVYTQGLSCTESTLAPSDIPIIKTDRGGQITYHGPGQLIVYLMLDLRRRGEGVKHLVTQIEQLVIDLLSSYDIKGVRKSGAPGIYVGDSKIAALGLRVRNGCTYHGLSLNIDMNLMPFDNIDPCGYVGLPVTQLVDLSPAAEFSDVAHQVEQAVQRQL